MIKKLVGGGIFFMYTKVKRQTQKNTHITRAIF